MTAEIETLTTPEIRSRISDLPEANTSLLLRDVENADQEIEKAEAALRRARCLRDERIKLLISDLRECWTEAQIRRAKLKI